METPPGLLRFVLNDPLEVAQERIEAALQAAGFRLFGVIDHAQAAAEVGLTLPPTRVLFFGQPKGGTPLMEVAPTLAIDLPSRLLLRETEGRTEVAFSTLSYALQRHGLEKERAASFDQRIQDLLTQLSQS
jgi:uncharacterized protein (DUF302 family)